MGKKLLFALALFIITIPVVMACDYKTQVELGKLASNVNAHYTVAEEPDVYFNINIYNLQEDLYAEVQNNIDKETHRYDWTEENGGNITFNSYDIYEKVDFTIKIYAKETSCAGKLLRTTHVVTPRFNPYYGQYVCEGVPEFDLCQKWVDFEYSFEEMRTKVANYKASLTEKEEDKKVEEENKTLVESIKDFVADNYIYILSGVGVIVISVIVVIIIIRKRRVI